MASSRRWATSSSSSRRTTVKVEAVNPCLRAFCAERDLPSGERGPVDWAALARLAASRLREIGFLVVVLVGIVLVGIRVTSHLSYSIRRGWSLKWKLGKL